MSIYYIMFNHSSLLMDCTAPRRIAVFLPLTTSRFTEYILVIVPQNSEHTATV